MLYELIEVVKDHLTQENTPSGECAICLYGFMKDDVFTKTPCFHYFHSHCLARYLHHSLKQQVEEANEMTSHQHMALLSPEESELTATKMVCPICRSSISPNLEGGNFPPPKLAEVQDSGIAVTPDMQAFNERMHHLFLKQKAQGGIIDVEEERKRFLLEISTIPTETVSLRSHESLVTEGSTVDIIAADHFENKPDGGVSHEEEANKPKVSLKGVSNGNRRQTRPRMNGSPVCRPNNLQEPAPSSLVQMNSPHSSKPARRRRVDNKSWHNHVASNVSVISNNPGTCYLQSEDQLILDMDVYDHARVTRRMAYTVHEKGESRLNGRNTVQSRDCQETNAMPESKWNSTAFERAHTPPSSHSRKPRYYHNESSRHLKYRTLSKNQPINDCYLTNHHHSKSSLQSLDSVHLPQSIKINKEESDICLTSRREHKNLSLNGQYSANHGCNNFTKLPMQSSASNSGPREASASEVKGQESPKCSNNNFDPNKWQINYRHSKDYCRNGSISASLHCSVSTSSPPNQSKRCPNDRGGKTRTRWINHRHSTDNRQNDGKKSSDAKHTSDKSNVRDEINLQKVEDKAPTRNQNTQGSNKHLSKPKSNKMKWATENSTRLNFETDENLNATQLDACSNQQVSNSEATSAQKHIPAITELDGEEERSCDLTLHPSKQVRPPPGFDVQPFTYVQGISLPPGFSTR